MNFNKYKKYLGLIAGLLLCVTGIIFCVEYVFEAYISRIGDPDQSLLFWYIPLLIIGIFAFSAGMVLTNNTINRLKK